MAAAALLVVLPACHTMRFTLADEQGGPVVYDRKSFFLWGLVPTATVDGLNECPGGVASIREQTTFIDGVCTTVTLGIWAPRSSWYVCQAPAQDVAERAR